jgi:hypothetical protein
MDDAAGIRTAGAFSYAAVGNGAGTAGITSCVINSTDGSLSGCVSYPVATAINAMDVAIDGTDAYLLSNVASGGAAIFHCALNPGTGVISACTVSNGGLTGLDGYAIGVQ